MAVPRSDLHAADAVYPGFAWPPGLRVDVEFDRVRTQITTGGSRTSRTSGRYSIAAENDPLGLRVVVSDVEYTSKGSPVEIPEISGAAGALLRSAQMQPDYVVDRHGRVVAILGTEALREEIARTMHAGIDSLPTEARAVAQRLFDSGPEVRRVEARARERWSRLVEVWIGTAPTHDWQVVGGSHISLAPLPGLALPTSREARLLGMRPCGDGDATRMCAELELTSRLDAVQLAQSLPDYLQGRPGIDRIEVKLEERTLLLTEPATLRPHREQHEQRWILTTHRGARARTLEQRDETATRFRYPSHE